MKESPMSNLTVSVDDDLIKRARVRAIRQGTSLSAKVREFLLQYATESDDQLRQQRESATARLMAAMDDAAAQTSPMAAAVDSPRTLREELYEGDFRALARSGPPLAGGKA
jgi:plasmid stability protein